MLDTVRYVLRGGFAEHVEASSLAYGLPKIDIYQHLSSIYSSFRYSSSFAYIVGHRFVAMDQQRASPDALDPFGSALLTGHDQSPQRGLWRLGRSLFSFPKAYASHGGGSFNGPVREGIMPTTLFVDRRVGSALLCGPGHAVQYLQKRGKIQERTLAGDGRVLGGGRARNTRPTAGPGVHNATRKGKTGGVGAG